jgi:glycerophosphoryl diester phosphodiesterase
MQRKTLIAAHRGGVFLWPENSATAFRNAAGLALEQAECDVHLTSDGVPVVMHDATLDRMTDGRGPVAALDARQFAALRVRGTGGEAPPTLAQYLSILAGSPVAPRIEIKSDTTGRPYPGIVARTLEAVDAAGERGRAWIIGFHAGTMAEALRAGGLAGVAWLLETATLRDLGLPGLVATAKAHGFPEVGMQQSVIDGTMVETLRAAGIGIGTWGANHAPSIRRMLGLGVDIFATDDPPLAIRLRQGN